MYPANSLGLLGRAMLLCQHTWRGMQGQAPQQQRLTEFKVALASSTYMPPPFWSAALAVKVT
jgi:hypothetical protein